MSQVSIEFRQLQTIFDAFEVGQGEADDIFFGAQFVKEAHEVLSKSLNDHIDSAPNDIVVLSGTPSMFQIVQCLLDVGLEGADTINDEEKRSILKMFQDACQTVKITP